MPHLLVMKSLVRVGVRGNLRRWFANYLDGCTQHVSLKGSSSPSASATSCIPQGSILGPLLFIVAMDPVTSLFISNSGVIHIYTDDINYYKPVLSNADLLTIHLSLDW